MRAVGFSTGALARGDFRLALRMLRGKQLRCVELSALRQNELEPLIQGIDDLDLTTFTYVSVHAPSSLDAGRESWAVSLLHKCSGRGWPIIVHPNIIENPSLWAEFGDLLFIENMDKRKPVGRNVQELGTYFEIFPKARMCFDIGHARQVDPSMNVAGDILSTFRKRIAQVHVSEVTTKSTHGHVNYASKLAFRKVAHLIPPELPIILESRVQECEIVGEAKAAVDALTADRHTSAAD